MRTDRIDFLDLKFDRLRFDEVRARLDAAGSSSGYSYIVTPNVDHVVRAHRDPELRRLYDAADLCLCDSRVLKLLARLRGVELPLVPGSDLAAALFSNVIKGGDRIAVVGGTSEFVARLRARFGDVDFLHHVPPMGLRDNADARSEAAQFLASSGARFAFIAVGSPQQEMIANEARALPSAGGVALCIGAGLEFLTGDQKRAPRFVRRLGLEWAHRLATNPRRLWRRYLVDGLRIFPIYFRWRGEGRLPVFASTALVASLVGAVMFGRGGF